MIGLLKKLLGTKSDRDLKVIEPIIKEIHKSYERLTSISNDELRNQTILFRKKIHDFISGEEQEIATLRKQIEDTTDIEIDEKEKIYNQIDHLEKQIIEKTDEILNTILPDAFAVMKETAHRFKENEWIEVTATDMDRAMAEKADHIRIEGDKALYRNSWMAGGSLVKWDMVHYDVQLIGGAVLHQGKISEMATGEGKTLVATLPVYLNALPGKGVHLVTVNDYLARRDSEWMGVLYQFHGLTVDCIDKHEPNSESRRQAYLADITFGTNNEFGFDYLRDNMSRFPTDLVQRKHNYAIVDEVDSVLIDDARTPLIISGPTPKGDNQEFEQLKPYVEKLYNEQRNMTTKLLAEAKALLNDKSKPENEKLGAEKLFRAYRGLPKNKPLIKFLSEPGMRALMQKTENFYMAEQSKNMHLIDDDLYFVIEEKHNSIELTDRGMDLVNKAYGDENFYTLPDIGSDIAELEAKNLDDTEKLQQKEILLQEFSIKSERVHSMNQLLKAYALFEKDVEYVTIENKVKIVDEQTGRIMEGRRYSDGLHQAIEAKENVKIEAATQTYATVTLQNYFRMYSKLSGMTGTAETEAGELWDIYELDVVVIPTNRPIQRDDREDLVYKTKREKFNAVIDEIEKVRNAGRPVLVGTTSVETSELLSRMLQRRQIPHNVLNAKLHKREADIVIEAGQAKTVTIATNMAGRGTDIKLGEGVKQAGGLAIIGTERHESRRVDRQLRGRAGRQGDPGSSQFFVSLEDDLMRMFGSERIAKIMDRLGLEDGEVIQHSMITKSIERAQKKVEENNFGIRKRLLEYDDVMNSQREVIYKKRRHALHGERLAVDISNMMWDVTEQVISEYQDSRDYEGFKLELIKTVALECPFTEEEFLNGKVEDLTEKLFELVYKGYQVKSQFIAQRAFPVIKDVYENQPQFQNIAIPITDGRRTMQIVANLENSYNSEGKDIILSVEKSTSLNLIDDAWKEHLRELDELKQAVQNATYEQKDPLLIYKFESFELFKQMIQRINKEITAFLLKGNLPMAAQAQEQPPRDMARAIDNQRLQESRTDMLAQSHETSNTHERHSKPIVREEKKIGRNDKVKVRYTDGRIVEAKYKKVEPDVLRGECVIMEN